MVIRNASCERLPAPHRAAATIALFAAFGCAPAEHSRTPLPPARADAELPGPAPRGRTPSEAHALNADCEGCHAEIATEWRDSLHAQAHTDPVYQRAYELEPLAFCRGCHAPEADPRGPVPDAAAAVGVGCVTCHVLGRQVVTRAREASSGEPSPPSPHPVVRDARLGGTAACAGCHEFLFPDRAARSRPELMQATVSEHARSLERDAACSDCHMPVVEGARGRYRSHRFTGGRDAALVTSAVSVSARRIGASSVRISLTPRGIGHAFPTGDLFRRLEVSAEAVGSEWHVLGADQRYLARHWERDRKSPFGVVLRTAVRDDRPLEGSVQVDLELGERAAGQPIAWRVAYQRVEHPRSADETESVVEGEIELSSGTLTETP